MLETEGLQVKGEPFVGDGPLIGKVKKFPLSASLAAAVIVAVGMAPSPVLFRSIPDDLGVGAHQQVVSPALQFFALGTVNYFIIFPLVCKPHSRNCTSFLSNSVLV